jgi:shikimate kinase
VNIFLLGFMGSGKSSLGKKLATRLGREFVDLDELIEEKAGQTISGIFSDKGEGYFRNIEHELLTGFNSEGEYVVSLGGGAPCSESNIGFIQTVGISIYLKEPEDVLFGRLRGNKKDRPLIANLNDEALKQFISDKLSEREKFYERADFIYEKSKTTWPFLITQIEHYIR